MGNIALSGGGGDGGCTEVRGLQYQQPETTTHPHLSCVDDAGGSGGSNRT